MTGENGAYKEMREFQEEKFKSLTDVLQEGFHNVEGKLDLLINTMDTQMNSLMKTLVDSSIGKDMVHISIAREMLETQKATYNETQRDQQKIYKWYFRTLCWLFGIVITLVTGIKVFFPQWFGG